DALDQKIMDIFGAKITLPKARKMLEDPRHRSVIAAQMGEAGVLGRAWEDANLKAPERNGRRRANADMPVKNDLTGLEFIQDIARDVHLHRALSGIFNNYVHRFLAHRLGYGASQR